MIQGLVFQPHSQIPQQVIDMMTHKDQRGYISIGHGKWSQDNIPEYCSKIKQWKSKAKLYLGNNQYPLIINDICHIRFPNLRQINLWGNQISSIQLICHIQWPSLVNFSINGNWLVQFRSFRKNDMKQLKTLGISFNKINQLTSLTELNSDYMERIIVEFEGDQQMCPNINWLSRLQCKTKDLYVMSHQRINQQPIHQALLRRNTQFLVRK